MSPDDNRSFSIVRVCNGNNRELEMATVHNMLSLTKHTNIKHHNFGEGVNFGHFKKYRISYHTNMSSFSPSIRLDQDLMSHHWRVDETVKFKARFLIKSLKYALT